MYDPAQPPYMPPPRKRHTARNVILICAGALAVIIIAASAISAAVGGKPPRTTTAVPATPAAAPFATDPAGNQCISLDSAGYCPGDDPTTAATTPPAAPQYTITQQQAIDAANNYLSAEPGFSYQGLINQLHSAYGSGFSVADATFAVNHVPADWNQQAVFAARNYMSSEPGWSCSGLVQQLDSPYGGQFTQPQAEHGAQAVGLRSC